MGSQVEVRIGLHQCLNDDIQSSSIDELANHVGGNLAEKSHNRWVAEFIIVKKKGK